MFENMTDEQFCIWLAGYFDGEGCMFLPKKGTGAEMSLSSTFEPVIFGIQNRVGCGVVSVTTFKGVDWNTKYTWRVRNYADVERIGRLIYPYAIIKKEALDAMLERVESKRNIKQAREKRNREIVALAVGGWDYFEIAAKFNLSYESVALICRPAIGPGNTGHPKPEILNLRKVRHTIQTHTKSPVSGITTTTKLIKAVK